PGASASEPAPTKAAGSTPPRSASSTPAASAASRHGATHAASSPPLARACRWKPSPREPSPERRLVPPFQASPPRINGALILTPQRQTQARAKTQCHAGGCERLPVSRPGQDQFVTVWGAWQGQPRPIRQEGLTTGAESSITS